VPVFCTRQVLVKVYPTGNWVLSGTVTSAIKIEFAQLVEVGRTEILVAWGVREVGVMVGVLVKVAVGLLKAVCVIAAMTV
jgi:hypothetical protein